MILLKSGEPFARHELAEFHRKLPTTGGANWRRVFGLCVLAQLYSEGRHDEDGLAVLSSISAEDRGAFYAPEIHRLEGELRHRLPCADPDETERCFRKAILLARQRAEKAFELRATTSLARLWRDQGRGVEARNLLAPIYGWFTEGFDTVDLKAANALLRELSVA
jgi:uncharacterized small protein (DUF1192 family)